MSGIQHPVRSAVLVWGPSIFPMVTGRLAAKVAPPVVLPDDAKALNTSLLQLQSLLQFQNWKNQRSKLVLGLAFDDCQNLQSFRKGAR